MKRTALITFAALALLIGHAVPSQAHGGHFRGGVYIGPIWGPGWWGPPQPRTVIQQEPQEYLEAEPQVQQAWYYCPDPQGYYPYVKQCPKGWQKVTPTPAPPQPAPEALEPSD